MAVCPHCETTCDDTLAPCPTGDGYYCVDEAEYASNSDDPMLGRCIAERFIISSILGRGSMGKVYKARQGQVDRNVALKIFRAETLVQHTLGRTGSVQEREAAQARFVQEAKVLGKLSHPNCVTVYDFGMGEGDKFLYMAMEFVGGVSLRKAINRGLKFDAVVEIIRQILLALREAHSLGIVHRDLKPENIVLSYRFNTGEHIVKVLDFGIAKLLQSEEEHFTRAGALFGTPAYMSPEQCRGEVHTIGPQVDIYALGCILYEMVCGQLPYLAQLPQQMVRLHQEAAIPALNLRRGFEVPAGLEGFIQTCLAKDRNDRFPDADAAIAAFEQLLADFARQSGELDASEKPAHDTGSMSRPSSARSGVTHGARAVVVPENHLSGDVLDPVGKAAGALPGETAEDSIIVDSLLADGPMDPVAGTPNASPFADSGHPDWASPASRVSLPSSRENRSTITGIRRDSHAPAPGPRRPDRQTILIAVALVAVLICCALIFMLVYFWMI
jgi:serine/threonine protein kinase